MAKDRVTDLILLALFGYGVYLLLSQKVGDSVKSPLAPTAGVRG